MVFVFFLPTELSCDVPSRWNRVAWVHYVQSAQALVAAAIYDLLLLLLLLQQPVGRSELLCCSWLSVHTDTLSCAAQLTECVLHN